MRELASDRPRHGHHETNSASLRGRGSRCCHGKSQILLSPRCSYVNGSATPLTPLTMCVAPRSKRGRRRGHECGKFWYRYGLTAPPAYCAQVHVARTSIHGDWAQLTSASSLLSCPHPRLHLSASFLACSFRPSPAPLNSNSKSLSHLSSTSHRWAGTHSSLILSM